MQIGVVYPQTELPTDPGSVRAYVEAVAGLGYRHLLVYDHVLGADPDVHADWRGPYDIETTFHEPLVLFGFLAAITSLELVTGIVIAPQRQTALLAKQAAEVDILTEGRFRLGVGVGWNRVEYDALGQDFASRGRREEEQIGLLRRLWTERSVTHEGDFDTIVGAGMAPLPPSQPIPVWLGGSSPAAYARMGRLADGWFPQVPPGDRLADAQQVIAGSAREAGRDPDTIQMEGRVTIDPAAIDTFVDHVGRWESSGATHVGVNTMNVGLTTLDQHLAALGTGARAIGLSR